MALKWCLIKYRRDALLFSKVIHQVSRSHRTKNSPCGCGDLSVRLESRIIPHRHQVVVEVHWRGAQGWRSISWVVATFNHMGGSFNLSMAATGGVWIIPSFRIWGLCAACWAHFMCHHELWPTSVGHPFSFLNSPWGHTGGKHYQKITITIFRFVLQNFAILGYFSCILSVAVFSPYFRVVGLFLQYIARFHSREVVMV